MKTQLQMKYQRTFTGGLTLLSLVLACAGAGGCATSSGPPEFGKDIATQGPAIINARSIPTTIQLNQKLLPTEKAMIVADVKDFNHRVTDVKLKFVHVPVEVPMENLGGTTWRASLTPEQLQLLAVSGKTIRYEANVVANNDRGQTGMTQTPLVISIQAPEPSASSSGS